MCQGSGGAQPFSVGGRQPQMPGSLQSKIFVGFGLALLLLGAVSWASYRNVALTQQSAQWVSHTQAVLTTLNDINSELAGAESAHRAFLVSGDESHLAELTAAFEKAPALLSQ